MNPHWITLVGGLEIIGGAAMTRWPEIPNGWAYLLFAAGAATVIYGARGIWLNRAAANKVQTKNWIPMWRLQRKDRWPFRRVLPMSQAAAIAHKKTDGTLYSAAAEEFAAADPDSYYATALWDEGANQLYGTKLPSGMFREIPSEEASRCTFENGGKALKRFAGNEILFDNIHIKRTDMKRKIKDMKES